MISEDRLKRGKEFNGWLESIVFVDKDGVPLPVVLADDESDDPEGDRGPSEPRVDHSPTTRFTGMATSVSAKLGKPPLGDINEQ
ncbi:hypothetical protein ACFL0Q_08395 [Thermodesulfobacteriota bacterium]